MFGSAFISTSDDYINLMRRLFPKSRWGQIFRLASGTRDHAVLGAASDAMSYVHNRYVDLITVEAHPDTAAETLGDWERLLGLPEFGYVPSTDDGRRATAAGKLAAIGAQNADYFESIAEKYGATGTDVTDGPWLHWFTVTMPNDAARFSCISPCNSGLVEYTEAGSRVLSALTQYKPAHSMIYWTGV